MPAKTTKIKPSTVKPYQVVIGGEGASWKPGVVSLVDPSRLPLGAVSEAKNMMQSQNGVWSSRWGSKNYGASFTGPVTGSISFVVYNNDNTTTQWYLIMDNGVLKKAKDGGSWTTIGGSFSTANTTRFVQFQNKILICNGIDPFSYYDINSNSIVAFTALSTPTTPTLAISSTLSSGQFPLYYQVTAISQTGETAGCAAASISVNINRDNWFNPNVSQASSTSAQYVTVTFPQVANAVGYNIYISNGVAGVAYYLDYIGQPVGAGSVVYTDYGSAAINDFIEVPISDTTTAPKFSWMALSNNRLWACGDPVNPNRVYWAGTGKHALAINAALGGGWVDINPGGPERPRSIQQFRDGKGTPLTTILVSEPSGYGSTWHVDIQTNQIGNTAIAVPVLMQSMGTFGTLSPFGVIETNQNLYFHSGTGGFYSTGSIQTLFNVLATNEVSINIRPDVRLLNLAALAGVCGIEYDRKLWWSVPYASATNNRIFIYDLEKNNWNPYAFDFGVTQFIRYTDNSGILHLLAVPETGTHLIEISPNYFDDNGAVFETHLQTGLIHVSPDHVQFAHITYAYYEFSHPQGSIGMIFSGTPKNQALSQLASVTDPFGSNLSNVGFSSYAFSTEPFSYANTAPIVTTDLSVKKRLRINKLLNNLEAEVASTSVDASYSLNQIVVLGQYIPTADPSSWIAN